MTESTHSQLSTFNSQNLHWFAVRVSYSRELTLKSILDKENIETQAELLSFSPDTEFLKIPIFEYCRLYEQRIRKFRWIGCRITGHQAP